MRLTSKEARQLLRKAGHDPGPEPNKFRAEARLYRGVRYASKAEAARAHDLDLLLAAGFVVAWFSQVTVRLGVPENVYRPDFLVLPRRQAWENREPRPWFEDVKGAETAKFRRDKKLWASYGPLELRIIKKGKVVETIPGRSRWESRTIATSSSG